ncbi:MAG: hypothetical protein MUO62_11685 [Anaerolineales bacterium]|nr:hypothetical protein [Anaerolineales bacterium]
MKKRRYISLLMLSLTGLSLLLGACTRTSQGQVENPPQDAVYTAAAQTVVAKYTQTALAEPQEAEEATETSAPPTPEATQTQEPTITGTPTETPTITPIPDAIVEDDFSNTSLWYAFQDDQYGFEYKDGGYRIYNNILNGAIWSIRYLSYNNIRLEVDATRQAGPDDGYFGVVCRLRNDGDDYYALVIGDNGFYGILKMEDSQIEFLDSGIDEDEIILRGAGEMNRIRGVCNGDGLELYANDQLLLEVFDETFTSGDVGIVAGNRLSSVGIEVLFDNFALIEP